MFRIVPLGIAIVSILVWGSAGSALADTGSMPGIPSNLNLEPTPLPSSGTTGSTAGTTGGGAAGHYTPPSITAPPTPAPGPLPEVRPSPTPPAAASPASPVKAKALKRCSTKHGTRTCRYYVAGKLTKICTKKPRQKRFHCAAPRKSKSKSKHATAHSPATQHSVLARIASTLTEWGFVQPPSGPVVRIYSRNHKGEEELCSGSVILQGIILTAGHCIYSNPNDGDGTQGYYSVGSYVVVPQNYWDGAKGVAPRGGWTVRNMWTTAAYAGQTSDSGTLFQGGDWGIIELNPNPQGVYPGAVVGELNALWSQSIPAGSELYLTGYATAGAFRLASNGQGNAQYFCRENWDGSAAQRPTLWGNYWAIESEPCYLTGGASGGPEFARLSDGNFYVVAVNNRGSSTHEDNPDSVGVKMLGFWFEDRFGAFWNEVIGKVNAGE
jgi:hypothetical protein